MLFTGESRPFNILNESIQLAAMYGFIKKEQGLVVISNRIFESILYEQFISDQIDENTMYVAALRDKNQFIENGIS